MSMHPRARPGILLVDNHRAVREALAQLLEEQGLGVSAQASGRKEALAHVTVDRPDLALVGISR